MPDTQSIEQQPAATAAPATGRPPFRADHVGSLLRPPDLLRARDDAAAGRISGEELRAAEDTAIREVVRRQQEVGLASATDGELRRESWHMDFIYQLGGVKKVQDDTIRVAFHNKQKDYEWAPPSAHVVAPLTLEHTIFGDAFTFLADTVKTAVPKLTIPSLSMVHYRGGRSAIDESVYPDLDQFWADLAAAYAEEVRRLYDLGCRYLQLDDTSLAYVNDPAQRQHIAEIGGDPEHQHEQYIANINRALAGRPPDLAVTTHMCRGNNQSMWAAEGSYDFVAEALFNDLDVDGFFCEWDDERSGGFEPLRFVPKGKRVVLGLVTTKRGELESKDELKRRIDAAARFLDIDQLCLSPQCGFSSTKEGNDITPDQQWAKLALIVETAQEVWALWQDASTTGTAPFLIVNGPVRERIGMNSKGNVFGSGFRANATIGRAIRLTAINAFGLRPHQLDQATQGTPAKYTACIAENEEESPWPPLHVQFGLDPSDSAATAIVIRSCIHIEARHTTVPEQLALDIAGTVSRTGALIHETISALPVLGPEHARIFGQAGWSKPDLSQFIRIAAWKPRPSGRGGNAASPPRKCQW